MSLGLFFSRFAGRCDPGLCEQRNSSDTVEKRYYAEGEYYQQTGKEAAYFPDQIGSVRDTVDVAGGALLYGADYTPYGLQTPAWTASGNYFPDIRFAGMFTESNSAELLTPARLYEAAEGRFMGRDPLGYTPGPNLYAYAGGNPITNTDPSGLLALNGARTLGGACIADPELCAAVAVGTTATVGGLVLANNAIQMLNDALSNASAVNGAAGSSTPASPDCQSNPDLPGCEQQNQGQCTANNTPPLQRLHPDSTLSNYPSSFNYWSNKSTQDIIDSLAPGQTEPLIVDESGLVWQGNMRIQILQGRGVDVNALPRTPKP